VLAWHVLWKIAIILIIVTEIKRQFSRCFKCRENIDVAWSATATLQALRRCFEKRGLAPSLSLPSMMHCIGGLTRQRQWQRMARGDNDTIRLTSG
jgi:hypothetical protein